ncbi:MAG: hypothetical protein ABI207_09300 [Crocinitomicaceae bacterium]
MKKIRLHPQLMHQIVKEQKVTMQAVRMSLYYVFNSQKSVAIRKRAKELLQLEADGITEVVDTEMPQ